MGKTEAKNFYEAASRYLTTKTKHYALETFGYSFQESLSYEGQTSNRIEKVFSERMKDTVCAKIGPKLRIEAEFNVGCQVKGDCVMPIHEFLDLGNGEAAIISPAYEISVAKMIFSSDKSQSEAAILPILLCGLSAIYSLALQGYAHCDIKLQNLVLDKSRQKCVLIDLGSATQWGELIRSTTAGISFDCTSPSIRYDINSLAIAVARAMLKKSTIFVTKEEMFFYLTPLDSKYPTLIKMLRQMRVDEDIESTDELLSIWKNVYELAKEKYRSVSDFSPPSESVEGKR